MEAKERLKFNEDWISFIHVPSYGMEEITVGVHCPFCSNFHETLRGNTLPIIPNNLYKHIDEVHPDTSGTI